MVGKQSQHGIYQKPLYVLKDKVAENLFPNILTLIKAIKLVWIHKIPEEFCKNLIGSIPRQIKAVIKSKKRLTKYKKLIF